MSLTKEQFLSVIEFTPLVSIDLLIINEQKQVLLGKRLNRPAQNYWFVPGGRIVKNETIPEAFDRIVRKETGLDLAFEKAELAGAYDHIYDDNTFGEKGIGTHYVVLGYRYRLHGTPEIVIDSQHDQVKWWNLDELLSHPQVHENTKRYFASI